MEARKLYEAWLANDYFDEMTKKELLEIQDDEKEIQERFYKELEFGTAGLRGIIGAGTNRMNKYTVQKATQGIANYICKLKMEDQGVAIAYDSRHKSTEFALVAACCLAANGIKAYLFESLRPTPVLSFAVRYFQCAAGINITASHNPAEYNGYKVYWSDGAQITPPHDSGIMDQVRAIEDFNQVKMISPEQAREAGLLEMVGSEVDNAYQLELVKQVLNPESIFNYQDQIKIVYTPLHGAGNIPVRNILEKIGFKHVFVVEKQALPDGDFPTVSYPNPETNEAFELGLKLAKEKNGDLILATDPDADRLGVQVRDNEGRYHPLTGNMSGCLLADYVVGQKERKFGLPKDGVLIRSIVTTRMLDAIAKNYHLELIEVLTGFKYIGQKILAFEESGEKTYLFGMEESYGCLPGTYARDKDAVVAAMLLCEMAAFYKEQGKNLWDAMLELYEKYGYYEDQIIAVTLEGMDGLEKIQTIMNKLEKTPVKELGGFAVLARRNYKTGIIEDYRTNTQRPTGLPVTNALYFELEEEGFACVRPSGTEPKIKVYYGVRGKDRQDSIEKSKRLEQAVEALIR